MIMGPYGNTAPELFPAREEMLRNCKLLRATRAPTLLLGLPATIGARYTISFYKPDESLDGGDRDAYFSCKETGRDQVLFIDLDNGFEPECSFSEKHVRYSDVNIAIKMISPCSVITVF